jgi:hypothetical protein
VDSGVEAEQLGDDVSEATTEHPVEDTAAEFEEESVEDASVEHSAEDTAAELAPARKRRTRRSKYRSAKVSAH